MERWNRWSKHCRIWMNGARKTLKMQCHNKDPLVLYAFERHTIITSGVRHLHSHEKMKCEVLESFLSCVNSSINKGRAVMWCLPSWIRAVTRFVCEADATFCSLFLSCGRYSLSWIAIKSLFTMTLWDKLASQKGLLHHEDHNTCFLVIFHWCCFWGRLQQDTDVLEP